MALMKIRRLDENCHGLTTPKDDLRVMGLLDANGNLIEDVYVDIRLGDEDKGWSVERADGIEV